MTVMNSVPSEGIKPLPKWRIFSPIIVPGIAQFIDVFSFFIAYTFSCLTVQHHVNLLSQHHITFFVFVVFVFVLFGKIFGFYSILYFFRHLKFLEDAVILVTISFLLFLSLVFAFDIHDRFKFDWVSYFFISSIITVVLNRILFNFSLQKLAKVGRFRRNIVVVGTHEHRKRFIDRLDMLDLPYTHIAGVYRFNDEDSSAHERSDVGLGDLSDLMATARTGEIDDVVIAMPWSAERHLIGTIEQLKELPVGVYLAMDLIGFELRLRPSDPNFSVLPMYEVIQRPISGWNSALKFFEDYFIALLLFLILFPIFILISILIKIDSPGPIIFRQKRLGFNNRIFHIYKFRSMYHREDDNKIVFQTKKGDPRVTRVGRFLRSSSLDELPQLFNVLDGTMSLVGPRPHAISHNEEYGRQIGGYFARHKVKPGITGWAQVRGFRGETEELLEMEHRIRHDIYYAENWSLLFDIKILLTTLFVVWFQKKAY